MVLKVLKTMIVSRIVALERQHPHSGAEIHRCQPRILDERPKLLRVLRAQTGGAMEGDIVTSSRGSQGDAIQTLKERVIRAVALRIMGGFKVL